MKTFGEYVTSGPRRRRRASASRSSSGAARRSACALTIHASKSQAKTVVVGEEPRKVPVMRTQSWEALLYPGEKALPASSVFETILVSAPERNLSPFPSGEGGILVWFFVASLAAGFALKGRFGVTL